MASHHEPLKTLAPVDWNDVPQHDLETFMHESFAQGQIVVDSIPSAASAAATLVPDGRARAKTDSAVVYNQIHASSLPGDTPAAKELSARLRGEWREIKVSPKDNPLDISMYKLAGKDGNGSWFGRRSVHVGLSYEQWETGLRTEFTESMKVSGPPGSGGIRGIGAERHVEHREVVNAGHLDVFQLSAQFPGPTAPRDFITLLLTSDRPPHLARSEDQRRRRPLRQYMVVSKPCAHPECPPRQGMIRGHYESVEVIREIPAAALAKRFLSSADLVSGGKRKSATAHGARDDLDEPRAVEWLMVTRSDPGGSVPRFLVEKGAPLGIIGDAGKFLDWVAETAAREDAVQTFQTDASDGVEGAEPSNDAHATARDRSPARPSPRSGLQSQLGIPLRFSGSQDSLPDKQDISEEDQDGNQIQDADADADGKSDVSSVGSFASAPETPATSATNFPSINSGSSRSSRSSHSNRTFPSAEPSLEKKNQQELQEHRQKLDHSCALFRHPAQSDRKGSRDKSAAAWLAKLHRKHDKQEAKLRREMRRLDEKREHEERKAAARRQKVEERSERSSLALELELARADRDVALREMEMLRRQVGELQRENTMLVARMGRLGVKAPT